MASTRRHTTANAAYTLILLAMSSTSLALDLNQMTYKGCFSSSAPLSNHGSFTYQSSGHCQEICVKAGQAVLGLSKGNVCWCGDKLPAGASKVDDGKCDDSCDGYSSEMCGGDGYWTVYLSGTEDNVPSIDGATPGTSTATIASPSVVTQISPGKTVVKTVEASAGASSGSSGGPNPAAIAAGVVVSVVVVSGILAGVFFWLRYRRRLAEEEEYKQNQVSDFMRGGELKPPQTGYSSMSDSRLDPEFGNRRNSHGSIADNEDFSRKILRVANPDRS